MISRTIGPVTHLSCQCGRPPQLVRVNFHGASRYKVEALCCNTQTVTFSTELRATNEFQRIRAAQDEDASGMDYPGIFAVTGHAVDADAARYHAMRASA